MKMKGGKNPLNKSILPEGQMKSELFGLSTTTYFASSEIQNHTTQHRDSLPKAEKSVLMVHGYNL